MGPTSLPPFHIWVVIVWVRTGPTSRPPQFHIALMGLLMLDDDLLRCKRRRDELKGKEDNAVTFDSIYAYSEKKLGSCRRREDL